jgi:hypothetical protein
MRYRKKLRQTNTNNDLGSGAMCGHATRLAALLDPRWLRGLANESVHDGRAIFQSLGERLVIAQLCRMGIQSISGESTLPTWPSIARRRLARLQQVLKRLPASARIGARTDAGGT